jgi:hypothetical protein
MRKWLLLPTGLMIVIALVLVGYLTPGMTSMADEDEADADTWDQELRLRDAQEGFVGETGKILVIEPSGEWRLSRFVQDRELAPEQTGKLDPQELARLTQSLQAHRFDALPAQIAPDQIGVNSRTVTLTYGDKSVALTLDPGQIGGEAGDRLPAGLSEDGQRLLEIVQDMRSLTTDE